MQTQQKTATSEVPASRKPTHIAYWVEDREKGAWRAIGVAWEHADNKGLSIHLDLQPLDGRITLRLAEAK